MHNVLSQHGLPDQKVSVQVESFPLLSEASIPQRQLPCLLHVLQWHSVRNPHQLDCRQDPCKPVQGKTGRCQLSIQLTYPARIG